MTPPHPEATGSYGADAERWIKEETGVTLRWWQRLAMRRQLEHDGAGELVWRQIVESTPRRSGKSIRLRAGALWRVEHAELFGEQQLVMHTGKDLPICKEIHRRAWRWAEERDYTVRRQNGNEEIEHPDGSRWMVRGRSSVYGYDVCYAMIDEAWAVEASVVDDGLEPAMLERRMPQLLLTSTAHRRATSLMRRRLDSALAGMGEDFSTLLMWWGAPDRDDLDIADPAVWRAASPHWTPDRESMIRSKLERALRGEGDPDEDDLDPMEAFRAQYLNIWPAANKPRTDPGKPVVTEEEWTDLNGYHSGRPTVAAIESWYSEGVALALAEKIGGEDRVGVSVELHRDVPAAVSSLRKRGVTDLAIGKSISTDPALVSSGLTVTAVGGTTRQAAVDLRRFIDSDVLRHDGSAGLTEQVLALRTVSSSNGPRLTSKHRADGVKAVVWATERARTAVEVSAIF